MKRRAGFGCTVPNGLRAGAFLCRRILPAIRAILFTGSVMVLSACGGGGGGGAAPASTSLVTGTFVRMFGPAASGDNAIPFSTGVFGDVKHQMLYTAAEIGGAGRITALRFTRSTVATSVTCPNTTIRLGHTSLSALTATFGTNVNQGSGSQRTVLDNTTVTIPASTLFEIPFSTPFEYNGIDNLVVEVERTTACSGTVDVASVIAGGNRRAVSSATDTSPGTAQHNQTTAGLVDTTHLLQQFVFSGGDDRIDLGGIASDVLPFVDTAGVGIERPRIQNLYLSSEINGAGPITGIAFQLNTLSVAGSYTYTLKLGHSTLATLGATFAGNYADSPVTVANAVSFAIPAGVPAGEWVWVPIPNDVFTYNGTDNLIVEVAVSAGTANTFLRTAAIAGRRVAVSDDTGTAIAGRVGSSAAHIALRFNGGTMDVIGASGASTDVFGSLLSGRQFLLRAAELGTSGAIDKLACRLGASSTAASYANFTVTLAHTAQTALAATDATNVAGGTTVFNATFNIPAGLSAGDWVEIPFSTPFTYNGVDNLVVQTTTGFNLLTQACRMTGPDAARFLGREKVTGGAAPVDFRGTFRFWVNK